MARDIGLSIFSFLAGVLCTWWFSRQSSVELRKSVAELQGENATLQRSINAIADGLARKEGIEFGRDDEGNVVEVRIGGSHLTIPHLIARGTGIFTPPGVYDRQHEQPPPEAEDKPG